MKKNIAFIWLITIITCSGYRVSGQEKVLMATCQMGQGCHFHLTSITPEEADLVLGTEKMVQNAPPGSMLVSAKVNGKTTYYMESEKTRSQLDQFYGGDGFTQIYLFGAGTQPVDGKWKIDVGTAQGSACFVDALPMIRKSLQEYSESGDIAFYKPFNPRQLMNNPNVKWISNDVNQYTALLDFGAPAGQDFMKMVYKVKVISEQKIEGVIHIRVRVPIPGEKDCVYQIPVTYLCKAPRKAKVDRLPDDPPHTHVERLPDDKPKTKVDRLEDDKPRTKVDLLPDDRPKAKVEILPDDQPKARVERLPDDKPKTKVERIP